MDKVTAYKHLNMISLECSMCRRYYPPYRILIQSIKKQQQVTVLCNREDITINDYGQIESNRTEKDNSTGIKDKNKMQLRFYCLGCFTSQKISHGEVMPQSYYDIGCRYINQLPIPSENIADQCLELTKQIQDKSNEICKQILNQIDNFKFFVLKLVAQTKKLSNGYINKLKYLEQLRIQERILLQSSTLFQTKASQQLHEKFKINQDQYIIQLRKKLSSLKNIKQKMANIKFTIPNFNQELTIPKRKKVFITDIPISSMLNFKGRRYFGANDGCIYYDFMSQIVTLKAHQSLIRSFSHDNQYTLYSGSDDFTIKAWDTHKNQLQLIKVFGVLANNKSYHRNICVINEGKTMISTRGQFDNFQLRLWSLQDQYKNIGCLDGHESFIKAMVIAGKQKDLVITASDDKNIKIWDTKTKRLIKTIMRPKKISNLLVSQELQLCAIMQQQSRVLLMDLSQYTIITGWSMPRKIITCCGYTKCSLQNVNKNNDYIGIGIPTNISIWRWDGIKIWSIDTQITYIPANMMQVSDKIITLNGTGTIDEFHVGNIQTIQQEVMQNLTTN